MKIILLLLVVGLVFGGALILYAATTKSSSPKPPKDDNQQSGQTDHVEVVVHDHSSDHSGSHGSSGDHGGGGHHGPSLLDLIQSGAFLLLVGFGIYWFSQNLQGLKDQPLVKHPIQVMTAGSNSVPVGSDSPKLNLAQQDYCQVPHGEVTVHQPSMTWTVVTLLQGGPGYEFCMGTLPDGKSVFAECSTSESGEDWGTCGRWSKRARVRSTDKPLTTWFESHVPM